MRLIPLLAVIPIMILGCGDGGLKKYPTAKVSGTVKCEGKPVGNVRVVFGPIAGQGKLEAGKAAFAIADDEGKFVLSTYGTGDGAVVGEANVVVTGPSPEDFPKFTCPCDTDPRKIVQKVTVAAGVDNDFTIELPKKTKDSRQNITPKQLQELKEEEQAAKEEEAQREKDGN